MKPRTLTLQAFGPFANREIVDFTLLPEDSLFLIHGPTGAGKSTLFDGICFALYGDTSGGDRKAREMRSHHAADSLQTEVELEFDLGSRRFLVKRIPEQERAALKGKDGLVKIPAKAELHEWDDAGWTLLASRSGEVNSKVEELLGFEAAQFRQVVMLPQNQFRELLAADSKEREKILEALFSTLQCKRLQEQLLSAARAMEVQANDAKQRRETLYQQAEITVDDELVQKIAHLEATLITLSAEETNQRLAVTSATVAVSNSEALATKFQEQQHAAAALETLDKAEGSMNTRRTSLANARRAQQVLPAQGQLAAATDQHRQQVELVEKATTAATKAKSTLASAASVLDVEDARAPERSEATAEFNRLDGLRAAIAKLQESESAKVIAFKERDEAKKTFDSLETAARNHAEKRKLLADSLEKLAPVAANAEAIKRDIAAREDRLSSVKKLVEAEKLGGQAKTVLASAELALAKAEDGLNQARKHRDALDLAWRAGQAAVLARHLVDGGPCPVCGSEEHPHLANDTDAIPTDVQIEAAHAAFTEAEAAVERSRAERTNAASTVTAQTATFDALRSALGLDEGVPIPSSKAAAKEISLLREQGKVAAAAQQEMELQKGQSVTTDADLADVTQKIDAARESLNRASGEASKAEGLANAHADAVPETLRGSAALESAIVAVRQKIEILDRALITARNAHQVAQAEVAASEATQKAQITALETCLERLDAARTDIAQALTDARFADAAEFDAALLPQADMENLEALIKAHDQEIAAARERLARANAAVVGVSLPQLDTLRAALATAQQTLEELLARQSTSRAQLEGARRTAGMLDDIRCELGDLEARYRVMGDLSAIANGRNGANLTFQRYVLAALLDNVLLQASHRLRAMSRNRYTLQRCQAVADGRRAAGLDLEVFDDYTGRVRPASTLSGGEGFLASLALALGLSDVVQGYAGGIQLDTLFIDEGFGTLDPESLDLAMKTLIDLRQQGRRVGIISHVDELKREIACGIEVRASPGGSSVHITQA